MENHRPSLKASTASYMPSVSGSYESMTRISRLKQEIMKRKSIREAKSVAFSDMDKLDKNIYTRQDFSGKHKETIINADGETKKITEFRLEPINSLSERKSSAIPSYMYPTTQSAKQRNASLIRIVEREALLEQNKSRSSSLRGSFLLPSILNLSNLDIFDDLQTVTQTDLEYPKYSGEYTKKTSTIADRQESDHRSNRGAFNMYQPTYQLQSNAKFNKQMAEDVITQEIDSLIELDAFDTEMLKNYSYVKNLMEKFTAKIKRRIKLNTPERYKLLVNSYIVELKNQDLMMGSKCLWDPNNDCFVSVQQLVKNHLIHVNLFAVYHD